MNTGTQTTNNFPTEISWSETDLTVKSLELVNKDLTLDELVATDITTESLTVAESPDVITPTGTRLEFNKNYYLSDGGTYEIWGSGDRLIGSQIIVAFRGEITINFISISEFTNIADADPDVTPTNVLRSTGETIPGEGEFPAIIKIYAVPGGVLGNRYFNGYIIERVTRVEYVAE